MDLLLSDFTVIVGLHIIYERMMHAFLIIPVIMPIMHDRTKIKRINYAISELKSFHLYLIHIILYLGRSDMA